MNCESVPGDVPEVDRRPCRILVGDRGGVLLGAEVEPRRSLLREPRRDQGTNQDRSKRLIGFNDCLLLVGEGKWILMAVCCLELAVVQRWEDQHMLQCGGPQCGVWERGQDCHVLGGERAQSGWEALILRALGQGLPGKPPFSSLPTQMHAV